MRQQTSDRCAGRPLTDAPADSRKRAAQRAFRSGRFGLNVYDKRQYSLYFSMLQMTHNFKVEML